MIKSAVLFIILFIANPFFAAAQKITSVTDERTGIQIIFVPEDKDIFPSGWMRAPVNGIWKTIKQSEVERTERLLKKALSKYPEDMPGAYLKKIYVFDYLSFYGVGYGGTYNEDVMYLTNGGADEGYTDAFLEGSFHHEFSSIVLNDNYSLFDERAWKKVNPRGFYYSDEDYGGAGAIMRGKSSLEFSDDLNEIGFLNEYSQSTIENDFNEFARNLFLGNDEFWQRVNKYPVLKEKVSLITKLYAYADPYFTKEYFYSLHTGN
jgi:hypothetical protein